MPVNLARLWRSFMETERAASELFGCYGSNAAALSVGL